MPDEKQATPVPYISFKTLLNLADRLEPEPPARIDKSVLDYLSGGYASQTLVALRALTFINGEGKPSEEFVRLVGVRADRKAIINEVWHRVYVSVFEKIEPSNATELQLRECFAEYGLQGATKEKAMTFFVHGAEFGEIPLSAHITGNVRKPAGTATPRRRVLPRKKDATPPPDQKPDEPQNNNDGSLVPAKVHAMLLGSIQWLAENGGTWSEEAATMWLNSFSMNVRLVYPPVPMSETKRKLNTIITNSRAASAMTTENLQASQAADSERWGQGTDTGREPVMEEEAVGSPNGSGAA